MEKYVALFVPLLLLVILIRVILIPMKWIWKILINSACGFLCLWLLNTIAGFTGIRFPLNLVTTAAAGFLGLPGIALLALAQVLLQ